MSKGLFAFAGPMAPEGGPLCRDYCIAEPTGNTVAAGNDASITQNTNEGLTKAMEFIIEVIGSLAVLFAASVIVAPVILGLILFVLFLKKRKRKGG